MNLKKLIDNKKVAYAILERRTKSTTTSCINDDANIEINAETAIAKLENLKKKFSGKNTIRGLYTELREALGFPTNTNNDSSNNNSDNDVSQYGFVNIDGKLISLRLSNHNTNADTYIEQDRNYSYNLSIVVSNRWKQNRFNPNDEVLLDEYVYYGYRIKDADNPLVKIIDSIIGYLKTGEYKNTLGDIPFHNVSPKSREEIDDSIINNSKNFMTMEKIKDDQYSDELVYAFKEFMEDEDWSTTDEINFEDVTKDYTGAPKTLWGVMSKPALYFVTTGTGTGSKKIDKDIEDYYEEAIDWATKQKGISKDEFYDLNEDDNEQYSLKEEIWELTDSYFDDVYVGYHIFATSTYNNSVKVQIAIESDIEGEQYKDIIYEEEARSMEDLKRIAKEVVEDAFYFKRW